MELRSYGKIYNLGHRAVDDLFNGPVLIEEKVDGSQFSFMVTEEGELVCRSKAAGLSTEYPMDLFKNSVNHLLSVKDKIPPNVIFRGEAFKSKKHNAINYDRCPVGHIALFDADEGNQHYVETHEQKKYYADLMGIEVVPTLFAGTVSNVEELKKLLETTSFLGGATVEGIVIKNYALFDHDGKTLMGKWVGEKFKEINQRNWKQTNRTGSDIKEQIAEKFCTKARWDKAIIHLREQGLITDEPRDIGLLIPEIIKDLEEECAEQIKEDLYRWAIKDVKRLATRGFPEWYKNELLGKQIFGNEEE